MQIEFTLKGIAEKICGNIFYIGTLVIIVFVESQWQQGNYHCMLELEPTRVLAVMEEIRVAQLEGLTGVAFGAANCK